MPKVAFSILITAILAGALHRFFEAFLCNLSALVILFVAIIPMCRMEEAASRRWGLTDRDN